MNTIEWLSRLVAFDTTSRNSNLELIEAVEAWFSTHQIETRITASAQEKKANLFATIPAKSGDRSGGIILSGHTDVVPVDGQAWDTPPFTAVQKKDCIYGRGTCDMKGFLAVLLALTPEFKKLALKHPVHLAFSYDEEIGCKGAPLLIADLQKAGISANACIVGEPTNMQPVIAHEGITLYHCRIEGRAAHSSLTPKGCNAIDYAAKLINYLRQLADDLRLNGEVDDYYDVPFTTLSTNKIIGGSAYNIIPEWCEFYFELRNLPAVSPATILQKIKEYVTNELQPAMQQEYQAANIKIETIASAPGFESPDHSALHTLVAAVSRDNEIRKVAYATEAGLFQKAHIETLICGPGSIEEAHRANEFVALSQLQQCENFLRDLIYRINH